MSGSEASLPGAVRAIIPRATYRLQLNAGFTLRDASAIIPYLARLGISHIYCSPYFRARPGSAHGYDVVEHNALNPEIADSEDFERFVAALRAHGMGHILDIVPNHVGIMGSDNAWWMDVLENGAASLYAAFFDIDWYPPNPALAGKLLVPVLGEAYGRVLERGELEPRFERERGTFAIFYHEHRFPLDPSTYPRILEPARQRLAPDALPPEARAEFENLIAGFGHLPPRNETAPQAAAERNRDKEVYKRRLAAMCAAYESIAQAIDAAVAALRVNGTDAASSDALHELLDAQPYRLASWRVASDEINYRRFFDINDLAALRMENAAVLEMTHRFTFELLRAGKLDGLRIDHPDGLYDPEQYFRRLQSDAGGVLGAAHGALPLYLVVEKIMASFEHLPTSWPVHGSTGYNFANTVNGLFVDSSAKARLDRTYHSFIGDSTEWREIAYDAKRLILDTALSSELTVLTNQLARVARADRNTRDFTFRSMRQALTDIIACFPVYRTYIAGSVSAEDRRFVDWAVACAKGRDSGINFELYEFIRTTLLLETPLPSEREGARAFTMKFQQLTAPVAAKGVEDTALYRYHRLVALNEVGGDPDVFGTSVRGLHADAKYRQKHWPHEMLATSTHDTKRSEDTRVRIDVLSEMPGLWRQMLSRWRRMNRLRKREIEGRPAPGPNQEYLLYQILLGTWPLGPLDDGALRAYAERIAAYMIKAAREAKSRTSWSDRSQDYEDALTQFVHALLEPREGNLFLNDLKSAQKRIARFGILNSLSQTLCKLTAPGMPDVYQGNELLDFSLVDPDNRRAVDYGQRARLLAELEALGAPQPAAARALLENLEDSRAKLYVTWRALEFRKRHAALFEEGEYLPARTYGAQASHLCVYARRTPQECALIIIPRLYAHLMAESDELPLGASAWGDTAIELPRRLAGARMRDVLTGRDLEPTARDGAHWLLAADALGDFPVALAASAN